MGYADAGIAAWAESCVEVSMKLEGNRTEYGEFLTKPSSVRGQLLGPMRRIRVRVGV